MKFFIRLIIQFKTNNLIDKWDWIYLFKKWVNNSEHLFCFSKTILEQSQCSISKLSGTIKQQTETEIINVKTLYIITFVKAVYNVLRLITLYNETISLSIYCSYVCHDKRLYMSQQYFVTRNICWCNG